MTYDAIVIGAGLSGLAAGIRLAMFDLKVCIVEKHTVIGGLNSFYVRKKRLFDVGLHAMTNYSPKGVRSSPLGKLLKQLRFKHDEFRLRQQLVSEIRFPGKTLKFSNDFELLTEEVREQFPTQIDGFLQLVQYIDEFDELNLEGPTEVSSREVLARYLSDPMLIDMLFCPLMYYGNAKEVDMDFYQFVIMFKSIFKEGFAKPEGGMYYILGLMEDKFESLGGEMIMGDGVASIHTRNDAFQSITLESGRELQADKVLSSMGYVETMRLCEPGNIPEDESDIGQMSFMESIFVTERTPVELGYSNSIVFYCTEPEFRYGVPEDCVDLTSGVLCCPNNFDYSEPLPEGIIRITNQANFNKWDAFERKDYNSAKREWRERSLANIFKFFPDFSQSVVFLDTFTPKTIKKYTGHCNGAVYGSPRKIKNGETPVKNLFICGTDQGFLGIVGATLSGISMANLHILSSKNQ